MKALASVLLCLALPGISQAQSVIHAMANTNYVHVKIREYQAPVTNRIALLEARTPVWDAAVQPAALLPLATTNYVDAAIAAIPGLSPEEDPVALPVAQQALQVALQTSNTVATAGLHLVEVEPGVYQLYIGEPQ